MHASWRSAHAGLGGDHAKPAKVSKVCADPDLASA
jgi:hypothetical protein